MQCWICDGYFDKHNFSMNPCYLPCFHVAHRACLWGKNEGGNITCGYQ